MRVDDTAPAEFLFGRLASDFLSSPTPQNKNVYSVNNSWTFTANLLISSIIFIILEIQSVFLIQTQNIANYLLTFSITLGYLLFSAYKAKLLVQQYGPDLLIQNQNMVRFSFIQIFLVHISFLLFSFVSFVVIDQFLDLTQSTNLLFFALFIFVIYLKIFADLSLVTIGFGTGLFTNEAGNRRIFTNFSNFSKYSGKNTTQIQVLRITVWAAFYYIITSLQNIFLIASISIIFLYYSQKWEKINASSLMMEIRGHVLANRPALIPNKIVETFSHQTDAEKDTKLLENPSFQRDVTSLRKKKKKRKRKRNSHLTGNLGSLAVRSITKIVDTIKHEENKLPSNMTQFCNNCGMEILMSINYCSYCGERV